MTHSESVTVHTFLSRRRTRKASPRYAGHPPVLWTWWITSVDMTKSKAESGKSRD